MNEYGLSVSFTTNHLGPFLFICKLLSLLEKTAHAFSDVRIINTSSSLHTMVHLGIKFDSIEDFNQNMGGTDSMVCNTARYGLSKLANILFAEELQRRFDGSGIPTLAIAVNPGRVKTGSATKYTEGLAMPHLLEETISSLEGALTALFAATRPVVWEEKSHHGGAYLFPFGTIADASEIACDMGFSRDLWETSETVIENALCR